MTEVTDGPNLLEGELIVLLVFRNNFIKGISLQVTFLLLFHVFLAGFEVILEKRWE